jgi:hypothetical protein
MVLGGYRRRVRHVGQPSFGTCHSKATVIAALIRASCGIVRAKPEIPVSFPLSSHSVWSLDGDQIAFSSSRMGFKDEAPLMYRVPRPYGQLFVMRDDGSDVRQLTDSQRG